MNVQDFVPFLFDVGSKSALLLLLALGLQWLFPKAAAAHRHFLLLLTLGACLCLPLLTSWLPTWRVPLLPAAPALALPQAVVAPAAKISYEPQVEEFNFDLPLRQVGTTPPAWDWSGILLAIWAIGAWIVLAQMLIGTVLVWLLRQHAQPLTGDDWQALVAEVGQALQMKRRVALYVSADVALPMTTGLRNPLVFLPAAARQWSREQLRTVLLHELAHVKRHDCLTQLIATLAGAMYWFNPLVWLAARQLRTLRELACDDEVLAAGTRASDYASCLVNVAQAVEGTKYVSPLAVGMACSQLGTRVASILNPTQKRQLLSQLLSGRFVVMLTLLIASLLIPLAAFQPFAQAPAPAPQAETQIREARQAEEKARAESHRALDEARRLLQQQRELSEAQRQALEQELRQVERAREEVLGKAVEQQIAAELDRTRAASQRAENEVQRELLRNAAQLQAIELEQQAARAAQDRLRTEIERSLSGEARQLADEALKAAEDAALREVEARLAQSLPLQRARLRMQIAELEMQLKALRQVYKDTHPAVQEQQAHLAAIKKELEKIQP